MLKGLALAFITVSSVLAAENDSSPEYRDIIRESEFEWIKVAIFEADRGVLLVFKEARRDKIAKSMVTVRFEVISTKKMPIEAYDPGIYLELGASGQRLLKQNFRPYWKLTKFGLRRHAVSMTVYNSDPKADKLQDLSLKFYFKQLGQGRSDSEAEFQFESLPIAD